MVEIIPKKTKKAPNWYQAGFYIAGAILILVILAYVILFYFENRAQATLQGLENQIAQIGTAEERAMEKEVLMAKKRINDFSELLQTHKKSLNFFSLLEKTCHPQVWLTELRLSPEQASALVAGKTNNFQTLDQQLSILREQNLIKGVELNNLLINQEGQTEFSIYLYLDPKIFQ